MVKHEKRLEQWLKQTETFANLPNHIFQLSPRRWIKWEKTGKGVQTKYLFHVVRNKKEASAVSGRNILIMFRSTLRAGFIAIPVEV